MKLRIARLGVLLAAVLGLMSTMVPSAQATTIKTITFTGFAALSGGLGYPCTPAGTTACIDNAATTSVKTGPKNEPQVNLTPGGNTAGFEFNSLACVKTSVSTGKATPKTDELDECVLSATGVVTGYCGLSTGTGVANLVNLTSAKATLTTPFKFTGVGGVLHVSGGGKATNLYAEVSAVPDIVVGGPSCTTKTATRFLLTGEAVYKDCTNGTTAGACNP